MKNPSSKQSVLTGKVAPSTQGTIIPLDYDISSEGFNNWTAYIRNELHVNSQPFTISNVIQEAIKVAKYHKPTIHDRGRE